VGKEKHQEEIFKRMCELRRQRKDIVNNGGPFEEKRIAFQDIDREIGLLKIKLDALSKKTRNKTYGRFEAMVDFGEGEGPKFSEIIIKDRSPNKKRPNVLFVSKDTDLACKLTLAKVESVIIDEKEKRSIRLLKIF
jgi:hypothetical protein